MLLRHAQMMPACRKTIGKVSRPRPREQTHHSTTLTLVVSLSALRTMVVTLPVATPPLLEICGANRTKLTEWCQGCGH